MRTFGEVPLDVGGGDAVDEHDHRLEHPAQAGKLHLAGQDLEDLVPGADQDAVELAVGQHGGEGVEAPGEGLGQGKLQEHDAEAQEDLLVGKSRHAVEPLEQEEHP